MSVGRIFTNRELNPDQRPGSMPSASQLRKLIKLTYGSRGANGIKARATANGLVFDGGGLGMQPGDWVGGWTDIDFTTLQINMKAHVVKHGAATYDIPSKTVQLAMGANYVTVRYQRHTSGEYLSPAPNTRLNSDSSYVYWPCYYVNIAMTGAGAYFPLDSAIYWLGMITLPGEAP